VDLLPVSAAGLDAWKDAKGFQNIRVAMFAAAKILGEKIRWGKDWDMDGKTREEGDKDEKFPDSPHFEIIL
jgi:peptidoglycan L-alanyl-D-glutamate endopeptidase CwlK